MTPTQRGNTPAETSGTLFTLFTPPQNVIDRRFYRKKYDAARIMAVFGVRLRDEVDLNTLSDDVLEVVREIVQPAHANLWLRPSDGTPAGKRDT